MKVTKREKCRDHTTKPKLTTNGRILDDIKKHGWFVRMSFDPDSISPSFAYSVGLPKH